MDPLLILAALGVLVAVFGFGYWIGWHDGYLEYKMMVDKVIEDRLNEPH